VDKGCGCKKAPSQCGGYMMDLENLLNKSWSSLEEMVEAIESISYDVLNYDEFEMDVIDCCSSDGHVETIGVKKVNGFYSIYW
jgi:hypothetical protein